MNPETPDGRTARGGPQLEESGGMNTLIAFLLRITGLRLVLVSYHQRRLRAASALMKQFGSDTEMPVWCSARFQRHQRALLRLGFLIERDRKSVV